jgi:hypothetical protein
MKAAYAVLPPFHCRVMWLPGMTAGSLWSLGNVGSIVAVEHLGQGVRLNSFTILLIKHVCSSLLGNLYFLQVGYSASQSALLIR